MNSRVKKNLKVLDATINKAVVVCAMQTSHSCDDASESLDSMAAMVELLSMQHQKLIWSTIGALLEMNKDGEADIPHSLLRKQVDTFIADFATELVRNIKSSAEEAGYPDIFDPNVELREEILNGNL